MQDVQETLARLSSEIFSEMADEDGDLGERLEDFRGTLSVDERRALREELLSLAQAPEIERQARLDDLGFSWSFDDDAGFFTSLSEVFDDL